MKKISIILAACVAALGFFSSCDGTEDDVMSLDVNIISQEEGKVAVEAKLIKTAVLELMKTGGSTDVSETYKKELAQLISKGNVIFTLPEGEYTLTVTDGAKETLWEKINIVGGATEIDWSSATNTISENGTYAYKQGDKVGTIVVSNLTVASVTVKLDDYAAVELSDAGASWLKKDGTSSNNAGLNVGSNMTADDAAKILCAKKNGEAKVVSGELTSVKDAEGLVVVKFK